MRQATPLLPSHHCRMQGGVRGSVSMYTLHLDLPALPASCSRKTARAGHAGTRASLRMEPTSGQLYTWGRGQEGRERKEASVRSGGSRTYRMIDPKACLMHAGTQNSHPLFVNVLVVHHSLNQPGLSISPCSHFMFMMNAHTDHMRVNC